MQHHLIALAARAARLRRGERGFCDGDESFCVRGMARRPRFRGTATLVPLGVAHGIEGPQEERSVLRREPPWMASEPSGSQNTLR